MNWIYCIVASLLAAGPLSADPFQFNRQIRPILSEHCFSCHGPDPAARKAGLRLDTREGLFEPAEKRKAVVVPRDLGQSELWHRVTTDDEDDVMPPPGTRKALSAEQKSILRQWVEEGALWQPHWSFIAPERPAVPVVRTAGWVRNPIDAFVLAKLEERGLRPAPEADHRTLARRWSLDVTGLPPRAEEVERLLRDRSSANEARFLEGLFRSLHYGEHRARYWLDAARYADTHGLHFDNYREMWPYRDWVIDAFNANMPFDDFTVEQLAGDLLPEASDAQRIATGFQRCNMTTNEGGTIEEENLAYYANDRVTTTSWVWLGLTANCASCHDHKFDPITMNDFYSMSAFFRNTKQGGFDRNYRESVVSLVVPRTSADRARWAALPGEIEEKRVAAERVAKEALPAFTNWLANPAGIEGAPPYGGEHLRLPLLEGMGRRVSGRLESEPVTLESRGPLEWVQDGPLGPAPVLTPEAWFELEGAGDFDWNEPFSVAMWVRVPVEQSGTATLLGRVSGEENPLRSRSGWEVLWRETTFAFRMAHMERSGVLQVRAGSLQPSKGEWHHLVVTYDGTARPDGTKLFVDGVAAKSTTDSDRLEFGVRVQEPLRLGRRGDGQECHGVALQDVRIYRRRLQNREIAALSLAPRLQEALVVPEVHRTPQDWEGLLGVYLTSHCGEWKVATDRWMALEAERETVRGRSAVTQVQEEKTESEPFAHVLSRGQYDQPKEKVGPATFAVLPPMPEGAPRNRLGLARWLVSGANPLTARVTVNRFWQELFGFGLVRTPEDFGVMGDQPTHPELLDWLAVEFVESGWDVRHLFRLMLTSATYRQSAVTTKEKLEADPDNRLLSRGPRFRMDAEMVRDYALAASGLLEPVIGGPSVRPYQPSGVWEAVAMPESNTRFYTQDRGASLYRRSLYTFWKRAAPPAALDVFNAPNRETCTVRRERTNTPLQALATLNDVQFVEAARHLAARCLEVGKGRLDRAVEIMASRLLARPLTEVETEIVGGQISRFRSYYQRHPRDADRLVRHGDSPPSAGESLSELAALTLVANELMNLDEVLNK